MVKNILLSAAFLFFVSKVFAGPEKYDHLEQFKKSGVTLLGPTEEIVQDSRGEQIARAVYKYNDQKQIQEITFFKNKEGDGKNIYIYDERGLKAEELYDQGNHMVEKIVYVRNKLNQIVEFEVFDQNNKSQLKWKFAYTDDKLTSGSRYIDEELTERFINNYTPNSIKQDIFIDNNENAGSITVILENSRITKRMKSDLTGSHAIDYFYDKSGRIEKMIFYNEDENDTRKVEKTHLFLYMMPNNNESLKVTME